MSIYFHVLIIGPCGYGVADALTGFLVSVGIVKHTLINQASVTAQEVIASADHLGGVPIVLVWSAQARNSAFVADLLHVDTLPGRPYILLTPTDMVSVDVAEQLEGMDAYNPENERVRVMSLEDLSVESVRETMRLHFTRACGAYIKSSAKKVVLPPMTDFPNGERTIAKIDRRIMQRGMFRFRAVRIPRF